MATQIQDGNTKLTWQHKCKIATQIQIEKTNTNYLTQIQHDNTNTTRQHKYCSYLHAGGYKKELYTASDFSCLVAAKLVTSLSLEALNLTGFGQDRR